MKNILDIVKGTLKEDSRLWTKDEKPVLLKSELISLLVKDDEILLALFLKNKEIEKRFFKKIGKVTIFEKDKFIQLVTMNEFLPSSFTSFENKIGLAKNSELLSRSDEISLVFPHKDCILEGGQSKEEQKRDEIFYNTILAPDEVDRLKEPKVFTNTKRISKEGEEEITKMKEDDNMIIKGNNLMVLYSLLPRYRGEIKLIYIDPPYNTGNDSFGYNDSFNHSSWLIFMKNRLELAKDLLKDDGGIFVQCDHNEDSYLRILLDEVFGPSNFVSNIAVKSSTPSGIKTAHKDKKIIKQKDTILFYKKNILKINPQYIPRDNWDKHYNLFFDKKNGKYNFRKLMDVLKENGFSYKKLDEINPKNEDIRRFIVKNKESICRLQSHKNKEIDKLSRTEHKDSVYEHIENGKLQGLYYNGQIITPIKQGVKKVLYGKSKKEYWSMLLCDFWGDVDFQNTQNEGGVSLTNGKKPEALIQRIIKMTTGRGDIILDYHLGSGTTAAVAHKMERKYIGIEQLDYEENDSLIRLKNVINGEQGGISKAIKWQGGGNFVYTELLEWNQKYISMLEEAKTDKTIEKIRKQIEKEQFYKYQINLDEFDEKEFSKLSLKDKKKVLVDMLDLNHLYVNINSIDDSTFKVSKKDKELNKNFYNFGK
ncbi:site-specific DNA-methyltransferase [bacterium]|nr:site-specific DNA-methyltransferase [bacterium]